MSKRAAIMVGAAALCLFAGSPAQTPTISHAASAGLNCGPVDDPTPTPVQETPTASVTPSATPTGTYTPPASTTPVAPSETPTASPVPTRCTRQPVEVVLVIDASTSMLRFTSGGRTKLAAALDAAGQLVDMLEFERGDRAAVVAFNDETWTDLMSDDRAAVHAALGRIPGVVQEGTRLDLALNAGGIAHTLYPARLGDAREVMILLTDGLPNRVPFGPGSPYPSCGDQECSTVKAAGTVKALGIEVVAIGLGDVLDRLMVRIPTDPGEYYYAPDGEDLVAIYRHIAAGLVSCGPSALEDPASGEASSSAPLAPAWTVRTVAPDASQAGERILVGGERAPTDAELRTVALYNRGHIVRDPVLERAGYGLVWTPGRDNARLDWRGVFDLQGSGVSAWREEVGTLTGPAGDETPAQAGGDWPNDTHFPGQWALRGLFGLRWADAWQRLDVLGGLGSQSIIAIIDNGLECAHPDLNCHVGTHYNGTTGQEQEHRSPLDTEVLVRGTGYDHGTFVGGIASAIPDNGYAIAGISRAAVVNAQGCIGGGCAESDVIRSLQWIGEQADSGQPIVAANMSFAFKTSRLCEPISELRARGIMPFAAVGNSGDRTTGTRPQYPAACPDAVGVAHSKENGALDEQAQRAAVSLTAPGSEVRSLCARPHTTGVGSGSSFASPAGAASYAVVRAALEPALGARAAEAALDVLYQTADPVEPATHARGEADPARDGYGRINLLAALAEVDDTWAGQNVPTPTPEGRPASTPTATPCAGSPEWCAAIGTATAISRGTSTPTPPPATPTLDPTVAAMLTATAAATPTPSATPAPQIDPTVAAILTAQHTPPTPDPTEVAKILTQMAPSPTPDKVATAHWLRCFVLDACAPRVYLPRLTR